MPRIQYFTLSRSQVKQIGEGSKEPPLRANPQRSAPLPCTAQSVPLLVRAITCTGPSDSSIEYLPGPCTTGQISALHTMRVILVHTLYLICTVCFDQIRPFNNMITNVNTCSAFICDEKIVTYHAFIFEIYQSSPIGYRAFWMIAIFSIHQLLTWCRYQKTQCIAPLPN